MFFKMYIRTYLSCHMYHLSHFHVPCLFGHHASIYPFKHSQGNKRAFYFYKGTKNSPKYFALNVPKLKGHYDVTYSNSIT